MLQRPVEISDGYGGATVSWQSTTTVHAQYRAKSGREQVEAGRLEATAMATLRCRAPAVVGVDESWRVLIGQVPWNIRSVIPFGQTGEWVDMTIERGGAGVAV